MPPCRGRSWSSLVLEVEIRFELGGLGLEMAFAVVVVAVAVIINAAGVDVAAVVVGVVSIVAVTVMVVAAVDADVGATTISTFPDIKPKHFRRNHIRIENSNKSMNGSNKNIPFSFSFPSTLPNGTLPHPNNEILNINLFEERFSIVNGPRGGRFSSVYCSCAAGNAVGRDGTSSTENGDGSVLLFDEREGSYMEGHSISTI